MDWVIVKGWSVLDLEITLSFYFRFSFSHKPVFNKCDNVNLLSMFSLWKEILIELFVARHILVLTRMLMVSLIVLV